MRECPSRTQNGSLRKRSMSYCNRCQMICSPLLLFSLLSHCVPCLDFVHHTLHASKIAPPQELSLCNQRAYSLGMTTHYCWSRVIEWKVNQEIRLYTCMSAKTMIIPSLPVINLQSMQRESLYLEIWDEIFFQLLQWESSLCFLPRSAFLNFTAHLFTSSLVDLLQLGVDDKDTLAELMLCWGEGVALVLWSRRRMTKGGWY